MKRKPRSAPYPKDEPHGFFLTGREELAYAFAIAMTTENGIGSHAFAMAFNAADAFLRERERQRAVAR